MASKAGAQSAGRSPTAREHSERPVPSWSSEGTFTTGHVASEGQEGYEEQFAVPDAAPDEGAAKGHDASRGPTGRKPAKADDQQQPTAKAATKRKSPKRKKKKLRAPDSAEESLSKPQGKDTGRQNTVVEVRYVVARTELFCLLEQDPILVFLKPMLMSNFTGSFVAPDFDSLTSVAHAAPTLFQMLRDSGFVLGAFEMERLCDWDLKRNEFLGGPRHAEFLDGLSPDFDDHALASTSIPIERGLQQQLESRKRKSPEKLCAPDSADEPPVKARGDDTGSQFTAAEMRYMLAGVELIRLLEHDPILRFIKPNAIKFTGSFRMPDFDRLTNVTRAAWTLFEMLHESGFSLGITERTGVYDWDLELWTRTIRGVLRPLTVLVGSTQRKVTPPGTGPISTQKITSSQSESSVHFTSRSKPRRDVDDEPADLLDVDFGMPKTTAAISTTTSPELDEVSIHLSEPPRATPREVAPVRITVLPDLKEAIPKALEEASTQSTTTQASNIHVAAVHVEPRNSTRKNSTQKMSTRDASKEMHQQALGNHAVMSVGERSTTRPQPRLGSGSDFDDRMNLENLAYEVTWDDDETWRDDELVWPMYGWPTDEDLEFDARQGEQEEEDRTGRRTCASEAAASPDDKSPKYGPSTRLREMTTEITVVRTTCVRSDQGLRRGDYAGRPDEAPGTEQQVEDSLGEVVQGVQFYGSSRQWGEMRETEGMRHRATAGRRVALETNGM
ncbi:hypothetical protein PHYSODRAFT_256685 [Phytophthora sojae]|uniref:Uncharacterized protein n=1 Tax=Phytophthora sojae (strain P6497) TaxID=1094619 RepID=G4Z277_PHYSP|nr:hypothetical protein PHYSODRAFT_256685 [Phytophthora sojae]EGZ21412.1 hypothetical protein PHYSODRAFT_256685 [Phytophthora sojae]|eukprot:XP_009524129.1 hypothetical protein PHYSODRAFT_256685 [Phytophthora sojae]